LVFLAGHQTIEAGQLAGTLQFVDQNAIYKGPFLSITTFKSPTPIVTITSGDFLSVPNNLILSASNLIPAAPSGYTLSSTYFTFVASSGTFTTPLPGQIDVDLTGTVTPGSGIPGVTQNTATLDLTILNLGAGETFGIATIGGTLIAPSVPPTVPEPSTLALLGIGIAGMAFGWRRRQQRA